MVLYLGAVLEAFLSAKERAFNGGRTVSRVALGVCEGLLAWLAFVKGC